MNCLRKNWNYGSELNRKRTLGNSRKKKRNLQIPESQPWQRKMDPELRACCVVDQRERNRINCREHRDTAWLSLFSLWWFNMIIHSPSHEHELVFFFLKNNLIKKACIKKNKKGLVGILINLLFFLLTCYLSFSIFNRLNLVFYFVLLL